jgi:hypothetical protein
VVRRARPVFFGVTKVDCPGSLFLGLLSQYEQRHHFCRRNGTSVVHFVTSQAWHPIGVFGDLSDEDIVVRIPL